MGNEFATVCCIVSDKGFVVGKVIGLGKMTPERFADMTDWL